MKSLSILFALVALAQSDFPPFFKKCNRKDPNVKECYKNAAQDGFPQLIKKYPGWNIPIIDPLEVEKLRVGHGPKGVVQLDQNFDHCKLYGFSKSEILNWDFDFVNKKLVAEFLMVDLKMQCHYEFDGKVLVLPVVGKGNSTIDFDNMIVGLDLNMIEEKRDGKTYLKFESGRVRHDPERTEFKFDNLFDGNKLLSDNVHQALNEGHKEIYADVKEDYEEVFRLIYQGMLNSFFSKLSVEDVFD